MATTADVRVRKTLTPCLVFFGALLGAVLVWVEPWWIVLMSPVAVVAGARERDGLWAGAGVTVAAVAGSMGAITSADARQEFYRWAVLILLAGALPWLAARAWVQRKQLIGAEEEAIRQEASRRELLIAEHHARRQRGFAERIHDGLGHDLSLLALRAGALELDESLPEHQRRAVAELRQLISAAVQRLGDVVSILREHGEPAPLEPVDRDVVDVIENARMAGMAIEFQPDGLDDLVGTDRRLVSRVVREGVTNAAKHAPGAPLRIGLAVNGSTVRCEVMTALADRAGQFAEPADGTRPAYAHAGAGSGIAVLRSQLTDRGGQLAVTRDQASHVLGAEFPARCTDGDSVSDVPDPDVAEASLTPSARFGQVDLTATIVRMRGLRRKSTGRIVGAVIVPLVLVATLVMFLGAIDWYQAQRAVITPDDLAVLSAETPPPNPLALLPERQLPLSEETRRLALMGVPEELDCRFFAPTSDPFADGSGDVVRVCLDGVEVASVDYLVAPSFLPREGG